MIRKIWIVRDHECVLWVYSREPFLNENGLYETIEPDAPRFLEDSWLTDYITCDNSPIEVTMESCDTWEEMLL